MKLISSTAAAIVLLLPVLSFAEPLDGALLYENHCSRCHLSLEKSLKAERRADRIRSAIKANIGGMGQLRKLKKEDIDAIAAALAKAPLK